MNRRLFIAMVSYGAVIVLMSCSARLSPGEYMEYFDKNRDRFGQTIERNGMKIAVYHYPSRYYVARDISFDSTWNVDSLCSKYRGSLFFVIAVADTRRETGSSLLERDGLKGFGENVFRNSFDRKNDIFMTNEIDTVQAAGCIYERNWGIGNEDVFLVTFSRKDVEKKKNLKLRIRELADELGTIEIPVGRLVRKSPKVQGITL